MRSTRGISSNGGPVLHTTASSIVASAFWAAALLSLTCTDSASFVSRRCFGGELPGKHGSLNGQSEPPVETDEAAAGREQRVLRQVIFRDRQTQAAVNQAETALAAGQLRLALDVLRQVFDQPCDHFIWIDREQRLASARRRAMQLLSRAPRRVREQYDWTWAKEAARLLQRAQAAGDVGQVADVSRRFFHTPAGFAATDWLATRWLDRGEYALAVRAWSQLATDPLHEPRMTEAIRHKSELAATLLSRKCGLAAKEAAALEVRTAEWTRRDEAVTTVANGRGQIIAQIAYVEEERPPRGKKKSPSPVPYQVPAWRMRLASASAGAIDAAISRWAIEQERDDRHPVAVGTPVVAGSTVAFRTYDGISGVDAATGRSLWHYASRTSFSRVLRELEAAAIPGVDGGDTTHDRTIDSTLAAYVGNSILGLLSTDGSRVFAVDSVDIHQRTSSPLPEDTANKVLSPAERIAKYTNRLIALDLFGPQARNGAQVEPLWTIGGSTGMPNWFFRMDADDDGRVVPGEFLGSREEFGQLDRNGDGVIDRAEAGQAELDRRPLRGHFFLGAPLALDGQLYAITECDCQLNLVALRADDGRVLWVQGIGYVDRPIDEDPSRSTLACVPVHANGVIICPTQIGVLVGVDATDGSLLWTYYYGDEDMAGLDAGWSLTAHRLFGNAGFNSSMLVSGNRLLLRPRHSDSIHCIDVTTGRAIWKRPRLDGEYLAAAAAGVVMVVGERMCRGLAVADGSEVWSARLGAVGGTGVAVADQYLLPLADQRIALVDVRTGPRSEPLSTLQDRTERGITAEAGVLGSPSADGTSDSARSSVPSDLIGAAGNLAASGDFLFSMGPREIVAYPRAEGLLSEVKRALAQAGGDAQKLLLAADLEMTLRELDEAKTYLAQAVRLPMTADLQRKAERLQRTILYGELESGKGNAPQILAEIGRLSRTPQERGRFLRAQASTAVELGNLSAAIESSWQYAAIPQSNLVPASSDLSHLISARSWLSVIDARVLDQRGSNSFVGIQSRVAAMQQAILQAAESAQMERFVSVHGRWPEAVVVRARLASALADRGDLQRAEFLLLQNRNDARPDSMDAADRALAHLWDRAGCAEEAAEMIVESEERSAGQDVAGKRGAGPPRLIDEFGADSLTRMAYVRLRQARRPIGRVRISQTFWEHSDNDLAEIYANASRPFVVRPSAPFQLIDHGRSLDPEISVLERLSGTVCGTIHVPSSYSGSSLAAQSQVGHFLPLGSRAALHGVSLLHTKQERPLWTTSPRDLMHDTDPAQVGPSGPTFCVFQSHRHLFVADPGTGNLLWQRTDLDPQSGLAGDPVRGIFGDDEVLVVFAADHLNYTVYRTATGEQLRQGILDSDPHHTHERRAFGRSLVHFTGGPTRRLQVWDPFTNRALFECEISERHLWKDTGENEFAVVDAAQILQIVDGRDGRVLASTRLTGTELQNVCQLAAFADADHYYVNLQPAQAVPEQTPEGRKYSYCFGTDTVLPRVDLRGEVVAIERHSGRLSWKRTFSQRSALRTQSLRLPVLILLSLLGDHVNGNHRSMLVEAVDTRTGETLGIEDNNFHNRILQLCYEPERSRVRLFGTRSVVDLDLIASPQGLSRRAAAQ